MVGIHDQHDFVARRDNRAAARAQGTPAAQHVDHARLHVRPDVAQLVDGRMRHRAAMPHPDRHDADAPFREFHDLQGLGKFDQAVQVSGDAAFGADERVDAEALFAHEFRMFGELGRANAGDAAGNVEELARNLARDHIGGVGRRTGDEKIGIGGAGVFKHRHLRAVSQDDAQVEGFLQVLQLGGGGIDDRDVVLLGHQVFRHAGAYATSAHDEDLHVLRLRADSMPNCLSLR